MTPPSDAQPTDGPGRAAVRRRSLRFLFVGGTNTAFGVSIFPALVWLLGRRDYLFALAISQVTSLLLAFTLHKLFVFRSHGRLLPEFIRFASFYIGVYAVNWAALPFLVEVAHVPPIYAQWGFAAVVLAGSYFWHSHVTFGPGLRAPVD